MKVSAGMRLSRKHSQSKGHDINFLALSGVLSKFGGKHEKPHPPPNFLASGRGWGVGGAFIATFGAVMALYERSQSGKGQTVDANVIEETAYTCSVLWYLQNMKNFNQTTGESLHDGDAPFYQTYQTSDGKFMAVGAFEAHIYELFLKGLGLDPSKLAKQLSLPDWPRLKTLFAEIFAKKTQAEWCETFAELDACMTPVLTFDDISELLKHKGLTSFIKDHQQVIVPRPVPFFPQTPTSSSLTQSLVLGEHSEEILRTCGFNKENIAQLHALGVIKSSKTIANL